MQNYSIKVSSLRKMCRFLFFWGGGGEVWYPTLLK